MLISIGIGGILTAISSYAAFVNPEWLSTNISVRLQQKQQTLWITFSMIVICSSIFVVNQFGVYDYRSWEVYFFIGLYFVAVIDAYSGIIPDRILITGLIGWAYLWVTEFEMGTDTLLAGTSIGLLLYAIRKGAELLVKKPGFGWGDIKLMALIGLFVGWDAFIVLYAAILFGGIFSAVGLITGIMNRDTKLHFAPFIFLGCLAVFVWNTMDSL